MTLQDSVRFSLQTAIHFLVNWRGEYGFISRQHLKGDKLIGSHNLFAMQDIGITRRNYM